MTQTNENAVETAHAQIESIKQGIMSGDTKLTSSDLSKARSELEFAELREEAKKHREERADEEKRRANLLVIKKQLSDIADSRQAIDKRFTLFEKSLGDYLSSVVVHQKELQSVRDSLQNGGFLNGRMPGPIKDINTSDGREVVIGEIVAEDISPNETIKLLIENRLAQFNQDLRTKHT
jgi:acetyl/propionyl-CoA carboxylase alpha subunit